MTSGRANPLSELAAVLFDMDGTLLDSEKVWDIALNDLAAWLGGTLSAQARTSMLGSNMYRSIGILHDDLGVDADPVRSAEQLTARTAELFGTDLVWMPGARELLDTVHAAGIPIALVTSTVRALTDKALQTLGRHYFAVTVCGDEVEHPKPHPQPYLRAAELLGVPIGRCVAIEDSPLGVAAAEASGAAVLAVPSEVALDPGPSRTLRESLVGVSLAELEGLLPG